MSQKICWKCREYFGAYSMRELVNHLHCHHPEPEEKPKCWWCRDWLAFTKESKGFPIYEVMKKLIGLNEEAPECPICGRKHKEAI